MYDYFEPHTSKLPITQRTLNSVFDSPLPGERGIRLSVNSNPYWGEGDLSEG